MNDLQKVEFEILKVAIDICNRLGLIYYMVCGSALGAAKYHGFIPWDDDIDIALPRKDYAVFTRECQRLLPGYYFLQNYHTEKGLFIISSKIRDCRTTYIERDSSHLKSIHHGVFIDVIPLDSFPENSSEFQKRYMKFNRCRRVHSKSNNVVKDRLKTILKPFFSIEKYYSEFEDYLMMLAEEECRYYCNLHNSKNGKLYYPTDVYGKGRFCSFNGLSVRVPEKTDEYLTGYYGDWRADLPKEQQAGHHYAEIIDLNRPYTDYVARGRNGRARFKTTDELNNEGSVPSKNK